MISANTASKKLQSATIGKTELVRRLAEKLAIPQTQADLFLKGYLEVVTEVLANGDSLVLPGFGSFEVRQRAERTGRNPKTGEAITLAATQVVGFKAGSLLKKAVGRSS